MSAQIEIIESPDQIAACYRALHELRPNLTSPEFSYSKPRANYKLDTKWLEFEGLPIL